MCSDDDANYEWICGQGAIGCTGSVLKPLCECNDAEYFIPSMDGTRCLPGKRLS